MEQKRDWRRPFNWAIASFLIGSIVTQTQGVDFFDAFGILFASLALGIFFAMSFAIFATIRTLLTLRPSGLMIPFYTLSISRSFQAILFWVIGMILKMTMVHLGIIGVVGTYIAAFTTLQRLWPDQATKNASENQKNHQGKKS